MRINEIISKHVSNKSRFVYRRMYNKDAIFTVRGHDCFFGASFAFSVNVNDVDVNSDDWFELKE